MDDYKDKVRVFRSSARIYLSNRKMYEDYLSGRSKQTDERFAAFIKEDMMYVEGTLDEICEKCGTAARLIVYLLYVENRTQEDVAGDYNITRRQLQYSLDRWMSTVFG